MQWPVLPCHCKKSPNKHSVLAPGTAPALVPWPTERTTLIHKLSSLLSLTILEDAPWLIEVSVEVPQPCVLLEMILQCLKYILSVLDLFKCFGFAFNQKREAESGVWMRWNSRSPAELHRCFACPAVHPHPLRSPYVQRDHRHTSGICHLIHSHLA